MSTFTKSRTANKAATIELTVELMTIVETFNLIINGKQQTLSIDSEFRRKVEIRFDDRDSASHLHFEIFGTCDENEQFVHVKLLFADGDELVGSKHLAIPVYNGNFHANYQQVNNVKNGFATKSDNLVTGFEVITPVIKILPPKDKYEDPGGEIKVVYATNRNRTASYKPSSFYGYERKELQTGICTISIPPGHKKGEIERPAKFLKYFFSLRKENTTKDVVLTNVQPYKKEELYKIIKDALALSTKKTALIFIHGYNTSFEEAAWRTGQLAHDLPFNGITGFFSWPSQAKLLSYGADVEHADSSIPAFIEFVEGLINDAGIEEIHFIAHSMGNRILTSALKELYLKQQYASLIPKISQVILAAPDLDQGTFRTQVFPDFIKVGKRHTIYASNKDKALKTSKGLMRDGMIRLGDAGDDIFVAAGIDSVDASSVDSDDNHHSYMFEEKEVLNDIYFIIEENRPPKERIWLDERANDSGKFWIFKM